LSFDTHVNRSDLQEFASSLRAVKAPAGDKGFDPGAIKLTVMKLTLDSFSSDFEPSRICDQTHSVDGRGDSQEAADCVQDHALPQTGPRRDV
jgi:hypothetical protein